jgi:hypothetical protein
MVPHGDPMNGAQSGGIEGQIQPVSPGHHHIVGELVLDHGRRDVAGGNNPNAQRTTCCRELNLITSRWRVTRCSRLSTPWSTIHMPAS